MATLTAASPVVPCILDEPLVTFGREICGELSAGLRREWLVTNGIGGYASATLAGAPTRSYHGYLVAALSPPVSRTVLVGGLSDEVTYDGESFSLSTLEWESGALAPAGFQHIEEFVLEGAIPTWRFALADAQLEKRVWMAYGSNTTYIQYRLLESQSPVELKLTPLTANRTFHGVTSALGVEVVVEAEPRGVRVHIGRASPAIHILSLDAEFEPRVDWWWSCRYREEGARGFAPNSDLLAPGQFHARLEPGQAVTLVCTLDTGANLDGESALQDERERQRSLIARAPNGEGPPDAVSQQLVLAADQFLVVRGGLEHHGRTVIAGYHWFNDWGRDTMIALPGLTIPTGRTDEAADILRTFARYVQEGLLPNNFPDEEGVVPGYNTVDATLWYVIALRRYYEATGDRGLVDELLPVLTDIIDHHISGTRHGIGVDPKDGLLRAGEHGVQLTWMDARVGDWVVTPRIGKPVEVNALWYNALRIVSGFLRAAEPLAADDLDARAAMVRGSFRRRFPDAFTGGLFDVVDGPQGNDGTVRPNQIFAISLPEPLLEGEAARRVLRVVGRHLLTSLGLRSLDPRDPAYRGSYEGDALSRDGGYHQGTVWPWLIGAYVDAVLRIENDIRAASDLLKPFAGHLSDAGLGSISEILDGDPPHYPRGCIAQAWSVAEVLRARQAVTARGYRL